jgi:hypothetical protein
MVCDDEPVDRKFVNHAQFTGSVSRLNWIGEVCGSHEIKFDGAHRRERMGVAVTVSK